MSLSEGVHDASQFDYAAIGHVTIDVLPDGTRRPGGSAFYSALQAARLGRRAAIITRGVREEIEHALGAHGQELALYVEPAPQTTTLATTAPGEERSQCVLAWAGPVGARPDVSARIVHLAPVAQELSPAWLSAKPRDAFLGLTPQGLVRHWSGLGEPFTLGPPAAVPAMAARCDAVVVSDRELSSCQEIVDAAVHAGASVAITAGPHPTRLITDGHAVELAPGAPTRARDDLGAGDVFAAAFFVALAEGQPPAQAAAYANAAAAVRVLGVGARAIGDAKAIDAHMHAR